MGLPLNPLRLARWITALAALALFVFVFFFDWYGGSVSGLPSGAHLTGAALSTTGWQTFTASRWVWLVTIVVALAVTIASARGYERDGPVRLSAIVAGLGAVSSGLIVYRIVHHPGAGLSSGSIDISYGIKLGIWLGLIATLALTLGGYLQAQAEQADPAPDPERQPRPAVAFSGLTVRGEQSAATVASDSPEDVEGDPRQDAASDLPNDAASDPSGEAAGDPPRTSA
jgi:hypothetical protein